MSSLKGACNAYRSLNGLMDPKAIQRIMSEYSKESMRQEMMSEMVDSTMDDALGGLSDQAEEDQLVEQVLSEMGISNLQGLNDTPAVDKPQVTPANNTTNTDLNDLENRLNNL